MMVTTTLLTLAAMGYPGRRSTKKCDALPRNRDALHKREGPDSELGDPCCSTEGGRLPVSGTASCLRALQ